MKIRLAAMKISDPVGGDILDNDEDDDVKDERQSVDSANVGDKESNLIWTKRLRKEFNSKTKNGKVAVNNFSLHVPRAECFCLLGSNGAGQ